MAEKEEKSTLDVLNEALDPLTPKEEATNADSAIVGDTVTEAAEVDGGGSEVVDAEAAARKPDGEGKDADEELDPATGKPKVKDEPVAEIDPATGKPKVVAPELGPDGKPVAPKPKDPLNDPMDSRWKEETRERFQSLVGMVKERDAQLAKAD